MSEYIPPANLLRDFSENAFFSPPQQIKINVKANLTHITTRVSFVHLETRKDSFSKCCAIFQFLTALCNVNVHTTMFRPARRSGMDFSAFYTGIGAKTDWSIEEKLHF
jgi:hypothetical protein